MEILVLGIWSVFACVCGELEAITFHKDHTLAIRFKYIHHFFTLIRALMAGVIILVFNVDFWVIVPFVLVFPYFHDGTYYVVRNKLNPRIYKRGWRSSSAETTAIFSFRYDIRLYLCLVGWLVVSFVEMVKYFK